MRTVTLVLFIMLFPGAVSAQKWGVSGVVSDSSAGPMIRSGWVSPVYSKLKWVPDPRSVTTVDVAPERREAGYWPDLPGGSSQQNGVVLLHFVENTTIFTKGHDNDRAFAILEHTFYNTALVERMEYITITAAASPEGNTADNERLAADRALAIKEHIMTMFPYLERDRIVTYSAGEDWNGLKRLIEEDLYVPGRDAALRLLGSPLPGNILRERLKTIAAGQTYTYISHHMFPSLRGGAACLIYFKEPVVVAEPVQAPVVLPVPITRQPQYQYYQPQPQPVYYIPQPTAEPVREVERVVTRQVVSEAPVVRVKKEHGAFMELKTNLLYDATATVNLGVEFPLGGKTSLDIPFNYNGWNWTVDKMWRHFLVQPGFRYWLKETFRGHFFGVHAHYAFYNVGGLPFNDYWKTHRFEGSLMGAGVSYGHRWNFRNPRWAIEAELGAGYAHIKNDEYLCESCAGETSGKRNVVKHWVGPTKIAVNLIYKIGGKSYLNKQKDRVYE